MKNLFSKIKVTAIMAVMSLFSMNSFAQSQMNVSMTNNTDINWHGEAEVDLGLPSGKIWATCNLGASAPWGVGKVYAWGDTQGYTLYSGSFIDDMHPLVTSKDLSLTQDAAHVELGGNWRTPTNAEFEELEKYCSKQILDWDRGWAGVLFTSKVNGNQIFFPATGLIYDGPSLVWYSGDIEGWYQTSQTYGKQSDLAYSFCFNIDGGYYRRQEIIDEIENKWSYSVYFSGSPLTKKYQPTPIRAIRTPLKPVITPTTGKIIPVTIGNQTFNKLAR